MLDEARSWSAERIRVEIEERRNMIRELEEAMNQWSGKSWNEPGWDQGYYKQMDRIEKEIDELKKQL